MELSLANKEMNDTTNADEKVPSLPVYGVLPRFPAINTKHPYQIDRMNDLATARK